MKQRININLIPNGVAQVIHLSQNDYLNGELEFYLFHGSSVLSDGIANAMIKGLKPDNNIFLYNATKIEGNVVTFNVTEQMTAVAGKVDCKLRIQTADGAKHSKAFVLDCEADPTTDGNVSESVIDALEELIEQVTEDAAEAQAAAESAEEDADRAEQAADDLVTFITRTGNPVVADKAEQKPLEKYVANIEPVQNLNGYDRPWAGGGGKNLLKFPYSNGGTTTKQGVKFTVNANGTVSASGTASADVGFDLASNLLSYLNVSAGQVIYFSSGIAYDDKEYLRLLYTDNNAGIGRITSQNFALTITEEMITRGILVQIRVISGKTASKTFAPMVSLEPVVTYEPYSNICQISGYTGVTVTRVGKNLMPRSTVNTTSHGITATANADGTVHITGTATAETTISMVSNFNLPAGSFIWSSGLNESFSTYDTYLVSGGTIARGSANPPGPAFTLTETRAVTANVRVRNGQTVDITVYPMVRVAGTTDTFEPYTGATYSVAFPSAAGTVYGGTLTVNSDGSGTLTVDMAGATFNGSESWSAINLGYRTPAPVRGMAYSLRAKANWLVSASVDPTSGDHLIPGAFIVGTQVTMNVQNVSSITDVATLKAYLAENPLTVVYPIAQPTTYALSAVQVVQMLEGTNVIWNDVKGTQEVTYWHNSALNTLAQNIVDMQEAIDDIGDTVDDLSAEVVRKDDITQSGTVTTAGQYVVDARQLNPTISGTIAKRVTDLEDGVVLKSALSRSTSVASTKTAAVDAYELNASKSGTIAAKVKANTDALNSFKFGFTSDDPPKPGYIVPGGADTVIPFKTGGIEDLTYTDFVITYSVTTSVGDYTTTRTVVGEIIAAGIISLTSSDGARNGNPNVSFEDDTMTYHSQYTYSATVTATVRVWYIPE